MSEKKYPSELQDRFIVRFPDDGMRTRIAREAATNSRSMNAEIVSRLQQTFEAPATAEAALLKLENNSLHAQINVAKVLEVTQGFLSAMLVKVIDQLPEPTKSQYLNVRALAEGIETGDSRKMGAAMMVLFESDPTAVRVLAETMEDLAPSIAARERGDDVAPFREDALNKLHQRREADAERALQPDYRAIGKSEDAMGLPDELRQIKTIPRAAPIEAPPPPPASAADRLRASLKQNKKGR